MGEEIYREPSPLQRSKEHVEKKIAIVKTTLFFMRYTRTRTFLKYAI